MGTFVNPFDDDFDRTMLRFAATDPGTNESHDVRFRNPATVEGYITDFWRRLDPRVAPWNRRSDFDRAAYMLGLHQIYLIFGDQALGEALSVYYAQARADDLTARIEAGRHFVDTMRDLARTALYQADRIQVREILKDHIGHERVPEIKDQLEAILSDLER